MQALLSGACLLQITVVLVFSSVINSSAEILSSSLYSSFFLALSVVKSLAHVVFHDKRWAYQFKQDMIVVLYVEDSLQIVYPVARAPVTDCPCTALMGRGKTFKYFFQSRAGNLCYFNFFVRRKFTTILI